MLMLKLELTAGSVGISVAHEPDLRHWGKAVAAAALSPRLTSCKLGLCQPTTVLKCCCPCCFALQASVDSSRAEEAARAAAAHGPSSVTFSAEDFPTVSGQGTSGAAPLGTWVAAGGGPGGWVGGGPGGWVGQVVGQVGGWVGGCCL
jgi:hypothetical protein